jgi:hypothetical protein
MMIPPRLPHPLRLSSPLPLLAGLAALLTACAEGPIDPGAAPTAPTERVSMIEAQGWREIQMISGNSARVFGRGEIAINTMGHFRISRNDCYREAWGAIELEPWNRLAEGLNRIASAAQLAEERCFERPARRGDYSLDFSADLLTDTGRVTLFDVRGSGPGTTVCTRIADLEAARQVLAVLDLTLPQAYREDCASE